MSRGRASAWRMKHFLLLYTYHPDILTLRAAHRGAHLAFANEAVARGELVLGGAVMDAPMFGALLFKGETAAVAEAFARGDPYVVNGVVTGWRIAEWVTVVGPDALTEVRV